jgi:hypothetical protein
MKRNFSRLLLVLVCIFSGGCSKPSLEDAAVGEYVRHPMPTLILSKNGKAKLVYDEVWDPDKGDFDPNGKTIDCIWIVNGEDIVVKRGDKILHTFRLEENEDLIMKEGLTEAGRNGFVRDLFIFSRQDQDQ